jgi:glutamate-ammonia-ligase adenylyltransferase
MALNNLERFLAAPGGPDRLGALLEGRGRTLETLLQLLGTSQFLGDVLAANPDFLDLLRNPQRRAPGPAELPAQLQAEVDAAYDDAAVLRAFRRFRQRQVLRVGVNDVIRERPLEEVTRDLSRVAEAALEVAYATAFRHVADRYGSPATAEGEPARGVVLAFGKLGGEELNYSSDIDLMFVYDAEGETRGRRPISNDDFFGRVVSELVRLLSAFTDRGQAYRVDLRLRPEGQRGPLARTLAATLSYYDRMGRTWERQALIKLRPVAGDRPLGGEFLHAVEPFVYRKYFSFSEINEVKALKRKIERKAQEAGVSDSEVKTGRGGIRDIEFTVQFLQLLNGGDLPAVRQANTLAAIRALEEVGCLTDQEAQLLDDAYRFLRKTEHRLQLLFDLQTHRLPDHPEELRKLARRMGYADRPPSPPAATGGLSGTHRRPALDDAPPEPPLDPRVLLVDSLDTFLHDYHEKTRVNRAVLDHLLHSAFAADADGHAAPEADLILDPDPDPATVRAVLGRYPFRDVPAAYHNLSQLAQESVPFLSTRRCRHFLASIAPRLLRALAETPDPDMALVNLEKVTASLGAKAVLWELFSFNQPSLKLYVDLCAGSQFLSEILINNPGMADELLDSLVLNRPRTAAELREELAALCHGAADPDPILHSFRDKELLRIGVRDLLGKNPVRETAAALSDLAETVLRQVATLQEAALTERNGTPRLAEGGPCRYALLALGKLGGREMSYHSDLDLVLVYEGDGRSDGPGEATDAGCYFTELARRIIRAAGTPGPRGKLYHIDMRLRPAGRSGSLAVPLAEFRRYHESGGGKLWERQALTKARVVHGDAGFGAAVAAAAEAAAYGPAWRPEMADEIRAMRAKQEAGCGHARGGSARSLKRGAGGLADVEFLVQLFQLKYGGARPELRTPDTRAALDALRAGGLLTAEEHETLAGGYDFLRRVEARLRIVTNRALDELPAEPAELDKLARRLGYAASGPFVAELERHTGPVRELFLRLSGREGGI